MCTGIRTWVKDNENKTEATFFSRTLEFGIDVKSKIVFKEKGSSGFSEIDGKIGCRWKSKYDYIGFDTFGEEKLIEGCNEEGLYVGAFYFPDYAKYPESTEDLDKSIGSIDFVDYYLSTFKSVKEIKEESDEQNVKVVAADYKPLREAFNEACEDNMKKYPFPPPLHWIMIDKSGDTIVIEYTKNGKTIYENPYGVFTNAPDFEWMRTNIRNYASLSAFNDSKAKEIFGKEVDNFGQGAGMIGLPGDFTPPSRFIRALSLSATATPVDNKKDGLNLAWRLIDNFDISKGNALVKDVSCNVDNTQWVSVYDLNDAKIYFRDYNNPVIREISLSDAKSKSSNSIESFSFESDPKFQKLI